MPSYVEATPYNDAQQLGLLATAGLNKLWCGMPESCAVIVLGPAYLLQYEKPVCVGGGGGGIAS